MPRIISRILFGGLLLPAWPGCAPGTVPVELVTRMEGAEGIVLGEDPDGWLLELHRWVSTLHDVELVDEAGEVADSTRGANFVLLYTKHADPVAVTTLQSPRGTFTLRYGTRPPAIGQPRIDRDVSDEVVLEMNDRAWTHRITGRAIGPLQPDQSLPMLDFELGFDAAVRVDCPGGVEIDDDGHVLEFVLDARSPFWTSLDPEPEGAFEAWWAADANDDGELTVEEIEAAPVTGIEGVETLYELARRNVARGVRVSGIEDCTTSL